MKDEEGTSAIEFALIIPVLLTLYFGAVEISNALAMKRKVENAATLAGSLVAQANTASDAYLANVFEATDMAFEPYATAPLKVVVTSIDRALDENDDFKNKVTWSEGHGSGASTRTVDSIYDPPGNILGDNRGIILTEVEYAYSSTFSQIFVGPITFTNTYWSHPRYVTSIPYE